MGDNDDDVISGPVMKAHSIRLDQDADPRNWTLTDPRNLTLDNTPTHQQHRRRVVHCCLTSLTLTLLTLSQSSSLNSVTILFE
jgi:hypothetical protein